MIDTKRLRELLSKGTPVKEWTVAVRHIESLHGREWAYAAFTPVNDSQSKAITDGRLVLEALTKIPAILDRLEKLEAVATACKMIQYLDDEDLLSEHFSRRLDLDNALLALNGDKP